MENNKKELDASKVKVYDLFSMVIIRFLFALSSIIAFFIVLAFLITAKDGTEITKFGVIETLLTSINIYVLNHYFGKKNGK